MDPFPYATMQDGEIRVRDIINYYRTIEVLHPAVSRLYSTPEDGKTFDKILAHDLRMLRGRSYRLEDHEVSIIQKAFIILMGDEEDRTGAIELYLDEIIGFRIVAPTDIEEFLATAIKAKEYLLIDPTSSDQTKPQLTQGRDTLTDLDYAAIRKSQDIRNLAEIDELFLSSGSETSPQHALPVLSGAINHTRVKNSSGEPPLPAEGINLDTDTNFLRLWGFYVTARQEFQVYNQDCYRRTLAAKFLRETIENAMSYLQLHVTSIASSNGGSDAESDGISEKLLELGSILQHAVEVVEHSSGGKNRNFEPTRPKFPSHRRRITTVPPFLENIHQPEASRGPVHRQRELGSVHPRHRDKSEFPQERDFASARSRHRDKREFPQERRPWSLPQRPRRAFAVAAPAALTRSLPPLWPKYGDKYRPTYE